MKPTPCREKRTNCEDCGCFQVESMSFCKSCGEFFSKSGNEWFNYDDREYVPDKGKW